LDPTLALSYPALDIRPAQLHAEPMAAVHAFKTANQFPFTGRMQKTDPGDFVGCAGDDSFETLVNPWFQQHGYRGFSDPLFTFLRRILLFGAVLCKRRHFIVSIAQGPSRDRCFQQSLSD
jgi:hypothetical protein